MRYSIRKYTTSDLAAVLNVWESATRMAHEFMTEEFISQERKNISALYLPNTDTRVAEVGGEVKGFVALMGNEIGALFVQPECHGLGLGKALMDMAKDLLGCLEVEVFKENLKGRKFYAKCGFELLEEKFHEPTGQKLLRLRFSANNIAS